MTELVIRLKDESKLEALLALLRRFTASEGTALIVESLERRAVIGPPNEENWSKWDELMNREKQLPGQPQMSPREEEEWIAEQVRQMRIEERAG
ncbi:MAG: hypothetical protein ACKVX9_00410 [Blastocatellia bacterium]